MLEHKYKHEINLWNQKALMDTQDNLKKMPWMVYVPIMITRGSLIQNFPL